MTQKRLQMLRLVIHYLLQLLVLPLCLGLLQFHILYLLVKLPNVRHFALRNRHNLLLEAVLLLLHSFLLDLNLILELVRLVASVFFAHFKFLFQGLLLGIYFVVLHFDLKNLVVEFAGLFAFGAELFVQLVAVFVDLFSFGLFAAVVGLVFHAAFL